MRRIRVVDKTDGCLPGLGRMLVRETIGKFLSGLVLGIGYLLAIWDRDGQAWHDKIAGTVTVLEYAATLPLPSLHASDEDARLVQHDPRRLGVFVALAAGTVMIGLLGFLAMSPTRTPSTSHMIPIPPGPMNRRNPNTGKPVTQSLKAPPPLDSAYISSNPTGTANTLTSGVEGQTLAVKSGGQLFPFTSLQAGFTQELFGVASLRPGSFASTAFAPNGDVWVTPCLPQSPLYRFVRAQPILVGGISGHPQASGSPFPSNAGCGIVNHPNGGIYANSGSGIARLDSNTGVPQGAPFGPAGGAHGIVADPQTSHLVYVGDCYRAPCNVFDADPVTQAVRTFATLPNANFVNGIAFDPAGNYLFVASLGATINVNGTPTQTPALIVLDRNGNVVQEIAMPTNGGPVGVGFHATSPLFVLASDRFGWLTRLDFPNNDFRKPPVQTDFATRTPSSAILDGSLLSVGPDSCLYVPVGVSFDQTPYPPNGVLRICDSSAGGGFR